MAGRCVVDDLGVAENTDFEHLQRFEIVRALVRDRSQQTYGTRQVAPLSSAREVWVLAHQDEHRGASWFDEEEHAVWLLAYGRHRSGRTDDFFPYCKSLDAAGQLFPAINDYEHLFLDRDRRFAHSIQIEAPLLLREAREKKGEHRVILGGEYGAYIAIEVADDVERTVIAFHVETLPAWEHVLLILTAFHSDSGWEPTDELPTRKVDSHEIAFEHLH